MKSIFDSTSAAFTQKAQNRLTDSLLKVFENQTELRKQQQR
jgi:hypothetical protein